MYTHICIYIYRAICSNIIILQHIPNIPHGCRANAGSPRFRALGGEGVPHFAPVESFHFHSTQRHNSASSYFIKYRGDRDVITHIKRAALDDPAGGEARQLSAEVVGLILGT